MRKLLAALILASSLMTPAFAEYIPPKGGGGGSSVAKVGGDGSGGALALTSSTDANATQYNATAVTLANGVTRNMHSGTVINATGAITIGGGASGSLVGIADTPGGAQTAADTFTAMPGTGQSPGWINYSTSGHDHTGWAGSGGGNGGAGGNGLGVGSPPDGVPPGGPVVPFGVSVAGSGGSSGASLTALKGGAGGKGGAGIKLIAQGAITIAAGATVSANGSAGSNPDFSGGSGGSGGDIWLFSATSITNNGTLAAIGGAGGTGPANSAPGAGGGGGEITCFSPSNTVGTETLTGGAAGTNANAAYTTLPAAGGTGQHREIVGTPNYPLIAYVSGGGHDISCLFRSGSTKCTKSDLVALASGGSDYLAYYYQNGETKTHASRKVSTVCVLDKYRREDKV